MAGSTPGKNSLSLEQIVDVTFNDVGGCTEAKRELRNLAAGIACPTIYSDYGITPPKGVLLHGPPGCGKTMLAKALANEVNAKCIVVNLSDIGSMWYGQSEKNLADAFKQAESSAKKYGACILYFDEIDALAGKRGGNDSSGVNRRIMSTFLTNLDGVNPRSKIFIVASTNDPEYLDEAFTRAGRIDRIIKIGEPAEEERKQIFDIYLSKIKSKAQKDYIAEVDTSTLAREARKFSGSDIYEVIRRTCEAKMWVDYEINSEERKKLTTEDFIREVKKYDLTQAGSKGYSRPIGFNK